MNGVFSTPHRKFARETRYGFDTPLFDTPLPVGKNSAERNALASLEECRTTVVLLATRWSDIDGDTRKQNVPDRTLELTILDLDVSFRGRFHEGDLIDIVEGNDPDKPNIRIVMSSDDLIAMTNGELKFAHAWATGRVRLDASLRDLLRMRAIANRTSKRP